MAKITDLLVTTALTGDEHLPIVQSGVTKRSTLNALRALIVPFLQNWYKGDKGDPGAAGNIAATIQQLRAASLAALTMIAGYDGTGATMTWTAGDFTTAAARFPTYYVASDHAPLTDGAWVRQDAIGLITKSEGLGAVPEPVSKVLGRSVDVFKYGAVGDGIHDDTAAFKAALHALRRGGTLRLGDGYEFLLSESLLIDKPVRIDGGAMEQSRLVFAANSNFQDIGDGTRAAIIFLHNRTVLPGTAVRGDSRRSVLSGCTVSLQPGAPAGTRGIVICAPIYLYEVRVEHFTHDGMAVMAGKNSPIDGIANGTSITNCALQSNHGSGLYFRGDDANACMVTRTFAADNWEWGFYDDGLLGNSYPQCEADSNGRFQINANAPPGTDNRIWISGGGFYANPAKPIASSYPGCYSETPTYFSLGPLCIGIGAQGNYKPTRASGGVMMRGLPSGSLYVSQPQRIAMTDDIAEAMGGPAAPGAAIQVSERGIDWRPRAGEGLTRWASDYSPDYLTMTTAGRIVTQYPNKPTVGNLALGRVWHEGGVIVGGSGRSGIVGAGVSPPAEGTFDQGAIWLNDSPAAGGWLGWVCVGAGAPGAWKAWGRIDD